MPFFNAEFTLERAIISLINQTYSDFECILINNNSRDKSLQIARYYAEKDSRIQVINEPVQGVVFASNKGFQKARGQFIARMDADDEAHPERLKLQADFLEQHPEYGAVSGLAEYISTRQTYKGLKRYVQWANSVRNYDQIKISRFIDSPIVNPTAMWRRDTAEKYGVYRPGDFPEDYEMWLRWLKNGVKISKVSQYILKWHDSPTRLTRTHSIYSDEAFYGIKTYYLAEWLKHHNPFHPHVTIWGASKISRKRAALLEEYGIQIDGYIDIKTTRQLDKPLFYYKQINSAGEQFILIYVRQWSAKERIKQFLQSRNYSEGKNFLIIS